jgi:hypothetical protein
MSCNQCANQSEPAMQAAGVPPRQTQATWAGDGEGALGEHCPRCGAFLTRQGQCLSRACGREALAAVRELLSPQTRREMYRQAATCERCGALKARQEPCLHCLGSGQVNVDALPPESRWLVGDRAQVTADELARAFAEPDEEGRLAALRRFPGLAAHLDAAGKAALWDEVRRYPALALLGHVPEALAGAGGVECLAWAAEQEPLAARAALRALDVIGQHRKARERAVPVPGGNGRQ